MDYEQAYQWLHGDRVEYSGCRAAAEAMDSEVRKLRKDAERYHWILRHYAEFHGERTLAAFQCAANERGIKPGLDGAIDEAIAAERAVGAA